MTVFRYNRLQNATKRANLIYDQWGEVYPQIRDVYVRQHPSRFGYAVVLVIGKTECYMKHPNEYSAKRLQGAKNRIAKAQAVAAEFGGDHE